jgi:hypothetical protein
MQRLTSFMDKYPEWTFGGLDKSTRERNAPELEQFWSVRGRLYA